MAKKQKKTDPYLNNIVTIESPNISVGIPTIGRPETLPTVITAIAFQTRKVDEIIILDEAKTPVMENYVINQALDVLSLDGISVKVIRNRRPEGIGAARYRLAAESRNNHMLMVDDDVVLKPDCVEMMTVFKTEYPWIVPSCRLIPADFASDGYIDKEYVSVDDPRVVEWTEKYPWFIPYFRYADVNYTRVLPYAGTQAILLDVEKFLKVNYDLPKLGKLPREDSVMTKRMGEGLFVAAAETLHYEHKTQAGRGNWADSVHYRLHEAAGNFPKEFVRLMSLEK